MDPTQSTAFKLHQATAIIDRIADDYLQREHGLRYSAFLVLLMVRVMGEPSQRDIAAALDVTRASITQRVAALGELLDVKPDPADSRANIVTLTAAGTAKVDAAWQGLDRHQSGLDVGLDEAALQKQLDIIIANGRAL